VEDKGGGYVSSEYATTGGREGRKALFEAGTRRNVGVELRARPLTPHLKVNNERHLEGKKVRTWGGRKKGWVRPGRDEKGTY